MADKYVYVHNYLTAIIPLLSELLQSALYLYGHDALPASVIYWPRLICIEFILLLWQ